MGCLVMLLTNFASIGYYLLFKQFYDGQFYETY